MQRGWKIASKVQADVLGMTETLKGYDRQDTLSLDAEREVGTPPGGTPRRPEPTKRAAQILKEAEIAPADVEGSGEGGKITAKDAKAAVYAQNGGDQQETAAPDQTLDDG